LERVQEREISLADPGRLQKWVRAEPVAPDGDWYKDFGSFKLCGSGAVAGTGAAGNLAGTIAIYWVWRSIRLRLRTSLG
jgi:hypothetical protein